MAQIEPGDREEMLLLGILNGDTTTNIEPGSRKEMLLKAILENGGGGGGGGSDLPAVTSADAGDFLRVTDEGEWDKDKGDDLARIDGYYENMTVGEAEQVISKVGVTEKSPYLLRPAGGTADIGNRKEIKKIVGASVVHNQLIQNGNFVDDEGWGKNRVTLTVADNKATLTAADNITTTAYLSPAGIGSILESGHLYLVSAYVTASASTSMKIRISGTDSSVFSISANTRTRIYTVSAPGSGTAGIQIYVNAGATLEEGDTVVVENVTCIDLTAMFGASIATAISTKETTLAGSGIAWLRSYNYLTQEYYAYNTGELISAKPTAHKTTGFNAWDEEWELGRLDRTDGSTRESTNTIRSQNYVPIVGGQNYYFNAPVSLFVIFYDANKNFISAPAGQNNVIIPAPANARYLKFYTATGVTTYGNNICINLSHSGYRDGDYEAYEGRSYDLGGAELRGILKLDDSGNIYADGDEYTPNGTITRRYEYRAYQSGDAYLENAITDGSHTVAKLTTATTETSTAYESKVKCDDFGTEEFVDERSIPVSVGHETFYRANNADKLDHLPFPADSDGDYIIHQSGKKMTLKSTASPLPALPSADGTYNLRVTVVGTNKTLSWEAIS